MTEIFLGGGYERYSSGYLDSRLQYERMLLEMIEVKLASTAQSRPEAPLTPQKLNFPEIDLD